MNDDHPLLTLMLVFAPLSLLAIGGGASILGDVQRQVVINHGWMSLQQFQEIFAISRVTPGPGMLFVTLIGWQVAGLWGAIVATISVVLPSSLLLNGLAYLWHSRPPAKWQKALSRGLAPIAAGLIIASAVNLLSSAKGGVIAWLVALLIGGIATFTRIGQIVLLSAGTALFVMLGFF